MINEIQTKIMYNAPSFDDTILDGLKEFCDMTTSVYQARQVIY